MSGALDPLFVGPANLPARSSHASAIGSAPREVRA